MVLEPWSCSFSSLCARMSRPGNTSSRCWVNAGSIDMRSSKCPWIGHSFTITILPSFSMMFALISPSFSFFRISTGSLPSRICWRISGMHLGQRESVSRGQPSCGFCFFDVLDRLRQDQFLLLVRYLRLNLSHFGTEGYSLEAKGRYVHRTGLFRI